MGRMHSNGKGISSSALPYKRTAPSWCKAAPAEVRVFVPRDAGEGLTRARVARECAHRERAPAAAFFLRARGESGGRSLRALSVWRLGSLLAPTTLHKELLRHKRLVQKLCAHTARNTLSLTPSPLRAHTKHHR
jgi:hypothetical protein